MNNRKDSKQIRIDRNVYEVLLKLHDETGISTISLVEIAIQLLDKEMKENNILAWFKTLKK